MRIQILMTIFVFGIVAAMFGKTVSRHVFVCLMFGCLLASSALAQATAFSYQGRLTDAGNPATGSFQMQFKLFDALSGGSQIGSTIADLPVTVSQGVFSARLDFGANALNGPNRWMEISVRRNSGEGYTTIAPREQIASSPYAVRTLSAGQADLALDSNKLGGVAASEYVTNATLSTNFIRNQTTQQASSNFNISGNGTIGGSLNINGALPNGLFVSNGTANFRGTIVGNTAIFGTTSNSPLSFSANNGVNGNLFLDTNGRVGIGTSNPLSTLDVKGRLTLDGTGGNPSVLFTGTAVTEQNRYLELFNSPSFISASGLKAGGILVADDFNFAQPNKNDLIVKGNVGIGTNAPNAKLFVQGETPNGVGIAVTGNASQSLNKGGWIKAMVFVLANGTIARCYNGLTGSSIAPCGFSARGGGAGYHVDFGFQVSDRFASVTSSTSSLNEAIFARITRDSGVANSEIGVIAFDTAGNRIVSDFHLIVY